MVVGWRSQEIDAQKSEDSRRCEIFLLGLDFSSAVQFAES